MKILLDMNLSPAWVGVFEAEGWTSTHWSQVGDPRAADREIMDWAKAGGWVVFIHDLDFGSLLAVTGADGPSVVQVRVQDVSPGGTGPLVIRALREHQSSLEEGALVVIDPGSSRVRILPLRA